VIRTALAAVVLSTAVAQAGGPVLPIGGVRSLERAGALVAGAEDADSLWLNPGGLAALRGDGKRSLLFDAAYVYQTVDYAPVDAAGAPLPGVSNLQPGHPVPQLAGALGIGERLVIAGGMFAPYDAVHRYAADGAQRFASLDTTGSQYFVITVGAAYAVSDQLRVGIALQNWVSRRFDQVVTSACTEATCDPTDASLDMRLDLAQTDYLAPAGALGLQYSVSPRVAFGAVLQSPVRVSGTGDLTVHVPTAMQFSAATVTGTHAALAYTLPPSARIGLEVRPRTDLRIEAALGVELWSIPGATTITPDHVQLENVAGGPHPLGEISIAHHGQTSFAPSIGVEWHPKDMMFGAGYAYETSATPAGDVSVASVDAAKHVIGLGGGYEADGWQIGAAVGIALLADVDVAPSDARVLQQTPLREPRTTVPINAGRYQSTFLVGGLRFARRF
jgi:long-subunit fatty acid transport protein